MITILYLALAVPGALGVGRQCLRWLGYSSDQRLQVLVFSMALGLGVLMMGTMGLGVVGLLFPSVVTGAAALWVAAGAWALVRGPNPLPRHLAIARKDFRRPEIWLVLALLLAQGLSLLRALAPPYGATDPLAYQLALPKLFLTTHHLGFEATITGALYPSNMGMLYAAALAVRGGALAQVVHWLTGAMTCVAMVGFARQYFSRQAGLWAAVIFSLTPVVVIFAPQGYIDLGLCFYQVVAFWALVNYVSTGGWRTLVVAALAAGLAMGIKHQGLATLAVGILVLAGRGAWRRDLSAWREVALFGGLALAVASPWYIRSMYYAGNPLWPLAPGLFGGLEFSRPPQILSGSVAEGRGLFWGLIPPTEWWRQYASAMSLWEWSMRPTTWQKAIGPHYLALLPGVVLLLRRRSVRYLLGGCLLYHALLIRALHMNPRYGLVLFAYLAVLCGLVAEFLWERRNLILRSVFAAAMALSIAAGLYWEYYQCSQVLPVVTGRMSEQAFLARQEPTYNVFQEANRILPPDAVVLLQGIVKGYYCDRRYLWDHPHQSVVDYASHPTPEQLLEHFRELGITHIVRMIQIPQGRLSLGYPQYFLDEYHEAFRRRYLKLLYRDQGYALFEVVYPGGQ